MTHGPTLLLKIPGSGSLVYLATTNSGNNFGATFWTDGRMDAPMWPDEPPLRVHPTTRELFWVDDCEKITEDEDGSETESNAVPFAVDPEAADWLQAIETGVATTPNQLRTLLIWFWWVSNDQVRRTGRLALNRETFNRHVSRLVDVLNKDDPNDRMMAADAARQIGQFDLANDLLSFPWSEEYETAAERIQALTENRDPLVRTLLP